MNKKKNKVYDAPALTVVTFKMEQGFATSGMRTLFVHRDEFDQDVNTTFGRTGYGQESESNQQTWF